MVAEKRLISFYVDMDTYLEFKNWKKRNLVNQSELFRKAMTDAMKQELLPTGEPGDWTK